MWRAFDVWGAPFENLAGEESGRRIWTGGRSTPPLAEVANHLP
jgi:hypothetical protein